MKLKEPNKTLTLWRKNNDICHNTYIIEIIEIMNKIISTYLLSYSLI